MVSMVAHRSPKPFVRVRVLLPLPKKTIRKNRLYFKNIFYNDYRMWKRLILFPQADFISFGIIKFQNNLIMLYIHCKEIVQIFL